MVVAAPGLLASMADSHTFEMSFEGIGYKYCDCAARVFGKLPKQESWTEGCDRLEGMAAAFAWLWPSFQAVLHTGLVEQGGRNPSNYS